MTDPPIKISTAADLGALIREGNAVVLSMKRRSVNSSEPIYPVLLARETFEEMLKRNNINRKMIPTAAAHYLQKMESGNWRPFASDPLGFAEGGDLMNGQNRALAAFLYLDQPGNRSKYLGFNIRIGMCISDVRASTDQGRSRTPADHLKLLGIEADAGALRLALFAPGVSEFIVDGEKLHHLYTMFQPGHDFVISRLSAYKGSASLHRKSAVVGALIRAYYHIDHKQLDRFIELMFTKPGQINVSDTAEGAVRNFREFMLARAATGSASHRKQIYNDMVGAIHRFVRGSGARARTVKNDVFPLPELLADFRHDCLLKMGQTMAKIRGHKS